MKFQWDEREIGTDVTVHLRESDVTPEDVRDALRQLEADAEQAGYDTGAPDSLRRFARDHAAGYETSRGWQGRGADD